MNSAGLRLFEVPDDAHGGTIELFACYPSLAPERPERIGAFALDAARDGVLAEGMFPLVVISHGWGGSPYVYRSLAADLARHGYVVLAPAHPGNHRGDDARSGTDALLERRPQHLRTITDWALGASPFAAQLTPDTVALVGHSFGGTTALTAAGGRPAAFAHECADGRSRTIETEPDGRIRALVLFAPAAAWFLAPGALERVRAPILMLSAEHDDLTPAWHADVIERGLPAATPLERRRIGNAGHFAFLTPFPDAMRSPSFAPSLDPEGFDREGFQLALASDVRAFLDRTT